MTAYLDTSFVVPYYLPEPASASVEAFFLRAAPGTLATSHWTEVEFASLLTWDVRAGRLQAETAREVLGRFAEDAALYPLLTPIADDFREATRLLFRASTGLRGPDALHLALVKRSGATLYTFDQTLLRAATILGVSASDAGIGAP